MNRLMIVARLRDGAREKAEALLQNGPPFDPEELRFERHGVYLTQTEVVFLFDAPEVEWIVNEILDDPTMAPAFARWQDLLDGPPRLAHERFYWSRETSKLGVGLGS
jgi:hypothetical protein